MTPKAPSQVKAITGQEPEFAADEDFYPNPHAKILQDGGISLHDQGWGFGAANRYNASQNMELIQGDHRCKPLK
jgi:hypothetical protein